MVSHARCTRAGLPIQGQAVDSAAQVQQAAPNRSLSDDEEEFEVAIEEEHDDEIDENEYGRLPSETSATAYSNLVSSAAPTVPETVEEEGESASADAKDGAAPGTAASKRVQIDVDLTGEGEMYEEYEDDEDEDEDEDEPLFNYVRLGLSSLPSLLKNDEINCFTAHNKFLVAGTVAGKVLLLDLNGNEAAKITSHSKPVNYVCLDAAGEVVISCADDAKVIITGLYSKKVRTLQFDQPIRSLCLSPKFSERKPEILCGGAQGDIFYNRKILFKERNDVIFRGQGAVGSMSWRGDYVVWADADGASIVNFGKIVKAKLIARVGRPDAPECSAGLCRTSVFWSGPKQFMIGWGPRINVCAIVGGERKRMSVRRHPESVQVCATLRTDYTICGLASYRLEPTLSIMALAFLRPDGKSVDGGKDMPKSRAPELRVVSITNEPISSDALPVRGYQARKSRHYWLSTVGGDKGAQVDALYYVVSPTDIVVARPRGVDDRLAWLLEGERFEEAVALAEEHRSDLRRTKVGAIKRVYMDFLIEERKWAKAAVLTPEALGDDRKLWERHIAMYEEAGQLGAIASFIPFDRPRLASATYHRVLRFLVASDPRRLLEALRVWPPGVFGSPKPAIRAVIERVRQRGGCINLMKSLAELYLSDGKFKKALRVYREIKSDDVFSRIRALELFPKFRDFVLPLMEINQKKALSLLADNIEAVDIHRTKAQLEGRPGLLAALLKTLATISPDLLTHRKSSGNLNVLDPIEADAKRSLDGEDTKASAGDDESGDTNSVDAMATPARDRLGSLGSDAGGAVSVELPSGPDGVGDVQTPTEIVADEDFRTADDDSGGFGGGEVIRDRQDSEW